jgi:hypothetical protein
VSATESPDDTPATDAGSGLDPERPRSPLAPDSDPSSEALKELSIDLEQFRSTLNLEIDPAASASGRRKPGAPAVAETLEELADDMLDLLRRVELIERMQAALVDRLDEVARAVREGTQLSWGQFEALRRDLLGDRRAQAALGAFRASLPAFDTFVALRDGLPPDTDSPVRRQAVAAVDSLERYYRGLGIEPFQVRTGEPFDPERMECLGYAEGDVGVVLEVVRAGHRTAEAVVRPAGVVLAVPSSVAASVLIRPTDSQEEPHVEPREP